MRLISQTGDWTLEQFLSHVDDARAHRTLSKLRSHNPLRLCLTGGLAVELHLLLRGGPVGCRPLNDIDFIVASFDQIPSTLGADFLFSHVHPSDPPNRTLLQSVDPETSVRVDIFHASGDTLERAVDIEICGMPLRVISFEDLTARAARLSMDLTEGKAMPAKHARDFLRLLPLADAHGLERAWNDHRKPSHPSSFLEVAETLPGLIARTVGLQIDPVYGLTRDLSCARCLPSKAFPVSAEKVAEILGYR
jgi:hypothetical protein